MVFLVFAGLAGLACFLSFSKKENKMGTVLFFLAIFLACLGLNLNEYVIPTGCIFAAVVAAAIFFDW
jgi:hypothetical protein